jgi:neutral ceramidase
MIGNQEQLRCGAARVSLEPPLGLPMIGFVRQWKTAQGYGFPLEATALVVESPDTAVALIGVDTMGIQAPEVDLLRDRIGAALGIPSTNVILNWNHTHLAPPGGRSFVRSIGQVDDDELRRRCEAYIDVMHDKVLSVAREAAAKLEPARAVWGLADLDAAVNRRERTTDGRVILGWHPDGVVDTSVPVLQVRRPDESAICTLVAYGCHTVVTGPDVFTYSADYPGPLRDAVREWSGGECVFFMGAGGNVLSRVAFTESEDEAARLGRALALEALHAVAGRAAWPSRMARTPGGSVTPFSLYRRVEEEAPIQALAAVEERVTFPLLPLPTLDEIREMRREFDAAVAGAETAGADPGKLRTLQYHSRWARQTEADIEAGSAPRAAEGPISAVRIGEGAIVTGPGEIFSEIGLQVKERSPAEVTLYAGYTNGMVSYFPTAAEYPFGGYEPAYGNRSFGLPAQVAPECEAILADTGARLVASLFPETPVRTGGVHVPAPDRSVYPPAANG